MRAILDLIRRKKCTVQPVGPEGKELGRDSAETWVRAWRCWGSGWVFALDTTGVDTTVQSVHERVFVRLGGLCHHEASRLAI